MNAELIALKGRLSSKSFSLIEDRELVIGRSHEADIQILDVGMSRRHCSLTKRGDEFHVKDLGSQNGTWVNDERVESRQLRPGDHVRFGGVEFQFRCVPDRRQGSVDLVAGVPDLPGRELKERVRLDGSDLMELPSKFESIENYRRVQRDLATIYRVGNLVSGESDPHSLRDRILDAIFEVVNADRVFLLIEDPRTGSLEIVARRERKALPQAESGAPFSSTIVEECFREGTSVLRADALADERYKRAESVIFQNIHSVVCVPVESSDRVLGVIYGDTVAECAAFTKHDLELLAAVGKQAGVAVQRARLVEQLQQLLRGAVRALVATVEAKDEYTRGHSERVTAYAVQIGKAMGIDESELRTLELAGLLHDVGKIGVPEGILRKAGPLTNEEFGVVKQHPSVGANILRHIDGAEEIAEIVLHHHERWDGGGYPDGLAAEAPSLLARILTVADAFDAMSSRRPYRDRLAQEKVLREIRSSVGRQFDPKVARILLEEAGAGRISSGPVPRSAVQAAKRD